MTPPQPPTLVSPALAQSAGRKPVDPDPNVLHMRRRTARDRCACIQTTQTTLCCSPPRKAPHRAHSHTHALTRTLAEGYHASAGRTRAEQAKRYRAWGTADGRAAWTAKPSTTDPTPRATQPARRGGRALCCSAARTVAGALDGIPHGDQLCHNLTYLGRKGVKNVRPAPHAHTQSHVRARARMITHAPRTRAP